MIGKVTSARLRPRLEKNIGYAMVPVEHSELGAQLIVERRTRGSNAVVADRVFFKPERAKEELERLEHGRVTLNSLIGRYSVPVGGDTTARPRAARGEASDLVEGRELRTFSKSLSAGSIR